MLISLSEVMSTKDNVREYSVPIELETVEHMGNQYAFHKKEPVEITITNLGDKKVRIKAHTNISLNLFCGRCLNDVIHDMELEVEKEIDFNETEEERARELDEVNYIVGYDLDVDKLVYDEILIGFPMQVLCSEDCKGLCKTCGRNLNEGTCDCDNTEYDPRMSVIRDIFKNFKEV